MRWIVALVVSLICTSTSQTAMGAQEPGKPKDGEGLIKTLRETREISGRAYSHLLPSHFMGNLSIRDIRGDTTPELAPGRYPHGYRPLETTEEAESRVLPRYGRLLEDVVKAEEAQIPAPIDLLSAGWNIDTKFMALAPYTGLQRAYIAEEYRKRPSSLRAVVELETALVEKELGYTDKYRKLLADAVERLDLETFDFRSDIVFRIRMPKMLNFVRPEVCLVFLHATELKNEGDSERALSLFRLIVEAAPTSPLAWLALAEMQAIDPGKGYLSRLRDFLTDFYPVFWGCTHGTLDSISKHTFKRRGDELLKLVSQLTEPAE